MFFQLFFLRVVSLPVWWYGKGLRLVAQWFFEIVKDVSKTFALCVWVKNLFVPMYGDTSFVGRAISFGIRLVMIFARGIGVAILVLALFVLFVVYLFILPLAIVGFFYHLL